MGNEFDVDRALELAILVTGLLVGCFLSTPVFWSVILTIYALAILVCLVLPLARAENVACVILCLLVYWSFVAAIFHILRILFYPT